MSKTPASVWLQEITWEEAETAIQTSRGTILVPVGSTEQHGPHLPLGTDTMTAAVLAAAAAEETNILAAPPLWFGWSPHHMVLPGTITIRPEILIECVFDVVESLNRHGFTRFVFVNGHRIVNVPWLQIVGERAKRLLGATVVIFDPAYMSKTFDAGLDWGEVGHAEEIEGSQMMYCYPELVKFDRAMDNPHKHNPRYHVDPKYPGDTLCYVPSSAAEMQAQVKAAGGTTGTPSKASREGGRAYHEHLVRRLVETVRWIMDVT